HLGKRLVAQDAGVVDEDVDRVEGLDRVADDALRALSVADGAAVGNGLAAERLDLRDHVVRRLARAAAAIDRGAEAVHHDTGTRARELQRVSPAEPSAGPGYDRDLPVEADCHCVFPPAPLLARIAGPVEGDVRLCLLPADALAS